MWHAVVMALTAGVLALTFVPAWSEEDVEAVEAQELEKVVLDDDDDGKEITLHVGQLIEISLRFYVVPDVWQVLEIDPAVVEQNSVGFRDRGAGRDGDGGWKVFTFKAVKPGTAELKFVYRPSGAKEGPAERTFTVTVTVEE